MFAACATRSMRIRETFGHSSTDSRIRALRLAFGKRGTGTMHIRMLMGTGSTYWSGMYDMHATCLDIELIHAV